MRYISLMLLTILMCSCQEKQRETDVKSMSATELIEYVNGPDGKYSSFWKGTKYAGTKDGFSYFHHDRDLEKFFIKVPAAQFKYPESFEFTLDVKKWKSWDEVEPSLAKAKDASR